MPKGPTSAAEFTLVFLYYIVVSFKLFNRIVILLHLSKNTKKTMRSTYILVCLYSV
jgi:hypothetical protein